MYIKKSFHSQSLEKNNNWKPETGLRYRGRADCLCLNISSVIAADIFSG